MPASLTPQPSSASFDATRSRSDGPLTAEELRRRIEHHIPLAYDPTAFGWLPAAAEDDVTEAAARLAPAHLDATAPIPEPRLVRLLDSLLASTLRAPQEHTLEVTAASQRAWRLAEYAVDSYYQRFEGIDDTIRANIAALRDRALAGLRNEVAEPPAQRALARYSDRPTRLTFRPWRLSDADRFVHLLDNPRVWQHLPDDYPNPLTIEHARDLIAVSNEAPYHEVHAVEHEGQPIGQVRLLFTDHAPPEISYWLGEDYWGHGLATELVTLATHRAFEQRDFTSIFARVSTNNIASQRVLEKAYYRDRGWRFAAINRKGQLERQYRVLRTDYI